MLNYNAISRWSARCLVLLALMLWLTGCGNKGDLYLESDAAAARELEEAAEKLRKKQKKPLTVPESDDPAE